MNGARVATFAGFVVLATHKGPPRCMHGVAQARMNAELVPLLIEFLHDLLVARKTFHEQKRCLCRAYMELLEPGIFGSRWTKRFFMIHATSITIHPVGNFYAPSNCDHGLTQTSARSTAIRIELKTSTPHRRTPKVSHIDDAQGTNLTCAFVRALRRTTCIPPRRSTRFESPLRHLR